MKNEVTKDQFTVVLEGIRSDFKVFGEKLTSLEAKVDILQATSDKHTEQLEVITGVVKQHSVTLQEHGATLQEHGGILKQHTQALARLEADVRELKERAKFTPNAQVFDKRIEVLEQKVSRIETTLKK